MSPRNQILQQSEFFNNRTNHAGHYDAIMHLVLQQSICVAKCECQKCDQQDQCGIMIGVCVLMEFGIPDDAAYHEA